VVLLEPGSKRRETTAILGQSERLTISKIFNTQGISLKDLSMTLSISQPNAGIKTGASRS
jgi:hypothetical protein